MSKVFAENRKARFEFFITETVVAGLQLLGTEVKAIRDGRVSIAESFIVERDGELFLTGCHVGECKNVGAFFQHQPVRERKLLLHKKEIAKLAEEVARKGITIVPLRMIAENGKIKVEIAVCKGKKLHDKREATKEREVNRDLARAKKGDY